MMNYALSLLQQEETELDIEAECHFKKWCAERQIKYESLSDDNVTEMIDRMIHQRKKYDTTDLIDGRGKDNICFPRPSIRLKAG